MLVGKDKVQDQMRTTNLENSERSLELQPGDQPTSSYDHTWTSAR